MLGICASLLIGLTACQAAVGGGGGTAGQPHQGGSITVAQSADAIPVSLLAGKLGNSTWAADVFQTLTVFNKQHQPQPLLAKSWKLAPGARSIQIQLRDDVTFSTGRKMTADDVKFSLEQAADPASTSQTGYLARDFSSINVTSPTSLTIEFKKPLPNIFDLFEQTFIVDPQTYSGLKNGSKVIGTGPYLFASWQPGSQIVLKRNPHYWAKAPYLDSITFAVITDETALINAVRSGRAQMAVGMNTADAGALASNPSYTLTEASGAAYPLGLDVTQPPLNNTQVRQAINYAIDRNRINTQVFGGAAQVTDLFWSPDTPGYPAGLAHYYTYDPAKARQMIQGAGAAGASIPITVISLPGNVSAAQIVRNDLQAVGLKPTINVVDVPTFAKLQLQGRLGPAFMPLNGLNGLAPISLVHTLPALRPGQNPSHFAAPGYSQLIAQLNSATSGSGSAAPLAALSKYLLGQAFSVPIVQDPGEIVSSKTLAGVKVTSRGYLDYSQAYTSGS